MRKIIALSLLLAAFAPAVAPANHCVGQKSAELWSNYQAVSSDLLGRVGCGAGRAEVADTNFLAPTTDFVYMVAFTPAVNSESQGPTNGTLKFNNAATKLLVFSWDGSRWSSQRITVPAGAQSVTASACVRPEIFETCKTIRLTYSIL